MPSVRLSTVLWIAFALRLAVPLSALIATRDPSVFVAPDSGLYLRLAASIVDTGRFEGTGGPQLLRPPGFPLLLAVGVALDHPVLVTVLLHALLGTLTVFLTYRIASAMSDRQTAILAAAIVTCEPGQLVWGARLLTETLTTTLVCLGVYGLLRAAREPGVLWCVLAAAGIAGAAYVRVAAYLLPLWMTASLLLARQWRGGVRLSRIVLFATVSVGFLGVWHARNYLVAGYAGFSVHLDRAIYLRPGTAATAGGPELAYADARRLLLERVGQQDDADWTGDATLARRMRTAGLETLREHPLSTVLVHLRGAAVTLLAPGATETLALYRLERPVGFSVVLASGSPRLIAARMRDMPLRTLAVSILLGLPLYILVAAALMGVREALASVAGIVVVSAALYFIVIGGGPHAGSRFRVPATPCLAVLASAPLVRLLARRQPAHHDDPRRGR